MAYVLNSTKAINVNLLETVFEDYFEEGMNAAIKAIPIPFVIDDVSLDASLVKIPQVRETHTSNEFVGKFYPTGGDLPFKNDREIPKWDPKGASLQIYISEFTLQSLLYTEYTLGNIELIIDESPSEYLLPFTTEAFEYFLPGLLKTYGEGKKTRIIITAHEKVPTFKFDRMFLILKGNFQYKIEVETQEDVWETAVIFDMHGNFIGDLTLSGKLRLDIKITTITLGYKNVVESNIGEINEDMIKKLLSIVESFLRVSLNLLFINGLDIGTFLPIDINLGEVDFNHGDGYITIQSTPNFDTDENKQALKEFVRDYIIKPKTENTKNDVSQSHTFSKSLKKAISKAVKETNFKEHFGKHKIGGVKSAYKGYKFFESVFNLPNPDFKQEYLDDL